MIGPSLSEAQTYILENDYILPSVQLLYDLIEDLKLPVEITRAHFGNLLALMDDNNISQKSRELIHGTEDSDLKSQICRILGPIDPAATEGIYNVLYTLLHEYCLNKSPDKAEDIQHNAAVAQDVAQRHLTSQELYAQTATLFNTLAKRLRGGDIDSVQFKNSVQAAIASAKSTVLTPPKKEISAVSSSASLISPTFLPKYTDPAYWKEVQEAQDQAFAEQLLKDEQEEADRQFALSLQDRASSDDDNDDEYEQDAASDDSHPSDDEEDVPEQGGNSSRRMGARH